MSQKITHVATNTNELQSIIIHNFADKYSIKQCNMLNTKLIEYFIRHQFDEWMDIADDIAKGYDDCCCKEILFNVLNVTDTKEKYNEYQRLKQCIVQTQNAYKLDQIAEDIIAVFTTQFNAKFAQQILTSFQYIIDEDEFDNIESIKDDMEDIDDSAIISYIEKQINYKQFDNQKNARNIVANGIKCICEGKTDTFVQQNESLSNQLQRLSNSPLLMNRFKYLLYCKLKDTFKSNIAYKALDAFSSLILKEQICSIDEIKIDLQNIEISKILNYLFNSLGNVFQSINCNYKQIITQNICDIVIELLDKRRRFNIFNFSFERNEESIADTIVLVNKYCTEKYEKPLIYLHPENPMESEQDKELIIAKSIDVQNGYPILLWLLDCFARDRLKGHKENYLIKKLNYKDDGFVVNYDIYKWWQNDNRFCKFLTEKHPKMAKTMAMALKLLATRTAPSFNFNHILGNIICDSLNAFAQYTLSMHSFIFKIVESMTNNNNKVAPLQFDFWIIPQATTQSIKPSIFDEFEVYGKDGAPKINRIYNEMGKSASKGKAQNAFWDLEKYLNHKNTNYIKGKDYIVTEVEDNNNNNNITDQLYKIWNNSTLKLSKQRYKRYVIIIDRRNPINLKHKNMAFVSPVFCENEKNKKIWKDKIYIIIPKKYGEMPKKYDLMPEISLALSAKMIFPNPEKIEPDPIKILDCLMGYKFCLSYHLMSCNNIKIYSYINQGTIKFELNDMEWFWSRFFDKINDKKQSLSYQILQDIKEYNMNKRLPQHDYDEFVNQYESIQIFGDKIIPETHPNINCINDLIQRLNEYFTISFNKEIGNKIATYFEYIVNDEEFEDLEMIRDDMYDIDESVIIPYVIQQINIESFNSFKNNKNNNKIKMIEKKIQEIVLQTSSIQKKDKINKIDKIEIIRDSIMQSLLSMRRNTIHSKRHRVE